MQLSRKILLSKALALGALLALAAWAPAVAAGQDDFKGWFVALDLANTQPNSLDQNYAAVTDVATGFSERKVMENDADFTYRFGVGYSFGKSLGRLSVAYWSFDSEDMAGDTTYNYVYPTIFGYGYNQGGSYASYNYPVTYEATSKVKATTIDVNYVRPMAVGEKFAVRWLVGLRSATYEEDQTFAAVDYYAYTTSEAKHMKSDAFGVRVGAGARFGFNEHFSIEGSMVISVLQANTDAEANRTAWDFPINPPPLEDQHKTSDDNVRGEIRDIDVRAVWSYQMLDYYLGYSVSTWDGLVADPLNGGACCTVGTATGSSRDTIAFNSLHGGVVWRFGKGK
jgi:hypothetical protein